MKISANSTLCFWQKRFGSFSHLLALAFIPALACAQPSVIDPTFQVRSGAGNSVNAIAVQSDGRILVGGSFTSISDQTNAYLARLSADGQFDPTFGSGTDGPVLRLLRQPDHKILVAGQFTNLLGVARRCIGRLLTNGLVDPDFDAGTFFEPDGSTLSLGLQADGKILVGTWRPNFRLFRLLPNGQPDAAFVQTNQFYDWWSFSILARTNGSILVGGGFSGVNGLPSPGLALFNPAGSVNTNFNSPLQNLSTVFSIVEQTNGGLLIAGLLKLKGTTNSIALLRLLPNLELDPNFTADQFGPPTTATYIRSIVLQPDGKLVAGGTFYEVGGYWRRHVVRLDVQGHVDPCFDPGLGLGGFEGVIVLAEQDQGRVLAGGDFETGDQLPPAKIARLLPQSDCGATRVWLWRPAVNSGAVIGTCAPGGTNHLQVSTNLLDWTDLDVQTSPYLWSPLPMEGREPAAFYRVWKAF